MVQVDVFWSYGIGAGFAAAASRQLKEESSTVRNPYFTKNLLFLALLFAPSGVMLLWSFTGWETMYLWDRNSLPHWIVPAFSITNITQGLLGFWVVHILIKKNKPLLAHFQWIGAYLIMFFILVHGWDGLGYRRFFTHIAEQKALASNAKVLNELWSFGPWMAMKWTISPVALTLFGMGAIILPVMFYMIGSWTKKGYTMGDVDESRAAETTVGNIIGTFSRVVFVWVLGSAIAWSLLIRLMGRGVGTLIFIPVFGYLCFGSGGLIRKEIDRMTLEPGNGSSAGN